MPLSFHEYYNLFYEDFFPSKGVEVFERYLETGGYLAYLNRKLRTSDIVSSIKADVRTLGKNTGLARDVIGAVLDVAPDPVSFRKPAEFAGLSLREFLYELRKRDVPINYTKEEAEADVETVGGLG